MPLLIINLILTPTALLITQNNTLRFVNSSLKTLKFSDYFADSIFVTKSLAKYGY